MTTHVLTCATKGCGRCIEVSVHAKDGFCFKCVPYGTANGGMAPRSGIDDNDPRVPLNDVNCMREWGAGGRKHQCNKVEAHIVHRCCCGSTCAPCAPRDDQHAPEPFTKADAGKPMMGCLPPNALLATARVLTHGADKYGRDNWHRVESWSRYYDALQRHLTMWWAGEDQDPDTKESHLAHAACCVLFLLELEALGKAKDDRPALGTKA